MRAILAMALALAPAAAAAESLVAARTIRAGTVLAATDIAIAADPVAGALRDPAEAIGLEARVILYAGRPIGPGDVGPPAVVERNQIVALVYRSGPLSILAEGRALARGGAGDTIRAMNLSSRNTVTGTLAADGTVHVGGQAPRPRP